MDTLEKTDSWQEIGAIGIDSGFCWLGDPGYWLSREGKNRPALSWNEFVEKIKRAGLDKCMYRFPYEDGSMGLGITTKTGYGDGLYPVFVKWVAEENLISEIKIVFIEK